MKPRILMIDRVYVCAFLDKVIFIRGERHLLVERPLGHGYTPREAYDDWKEQVGA